MKRKSWPARRDVRLTSQYIPETGDIMIGVARGFTGSGEVMYRLTSETLAGAIEDRKELAVVVNNLGLLALAQLCGFNLAEELTGIGKKLAEWGHIDVPALIRDEGIDVALAIAQKTIHEKHGHNCGLDTPDFAKGETCECTCECSGTENQIVCAQYCELCRGVGSLATLDHKDADEG